MTYEIVKRARGKGFGLVQWDPRRQQFVVDAPGGGWYVTRCEEAAREYAARWGEPMRSPDGRMITRRRDAAAEVTELEFAAELGSL